MSTLYRCRWHADSNDSTLSQFRTHPNTVLHTQTTVQCVIYCHFHLAIALLMRPICMGFSAKPWPVGRIENSYHDCIQLTQLFNIPATDWRRNKQKNRRDFLCCQCQLVALFIPLTASHLLLYLFMRNILSSVTLQ